MKNITKKLTILLMIIALLSGCVPAEYKDGVKIDRDYPDKELPIYDDAIVYLSEEDSDEITIKAGSEDDVEDVIEFYQELFEDEEVFILTKEKEKDDRYSAEGVIIGKELTFEIDIIIAKGKVEEKVFKSQFEIVIAPQEEKIEDVPKDEPTDFMDADVDSQFPIEIFSKYPGSWITESGSEDDSSYMVMFTKDDLTKVDDYYRNILLNADITSETTEDRVTTWIADLDGYSFIVSITDDPEELEEGYSTGIAILAGSTSDNTQANNGGTSVIGDFNEEVIPVNQTVEQGGIKFTINTVALYDNYKDDYDEITNGVLLDITIENTNKDKTLSLSPNYANLVLNTGEILDSDYWITSDNIGGDIIGEVIKNGVVYFPLKITDTSEINGFNWVISAPTDENYDYVGSEFAFSVELDNPNYQLLTKEANIERVYSELNNMFLENENFMEIYQISDSVYETGPVTMHLPVVALVSQYKDYNDEVSDYIVIGAMIEAQESTPDFSFYLTSSTLVTNTKEQLEADYTFSESIESSFTGGSYTYGYFCYKLVEGTIDQITGFDIHTDKPYDNESWDYLGDEMIITITLS